jgi:hypothetical protein
VIKAGSVVFGALSAEVDGLSDVFNLVVRPNPVLAPEAVYTAKANRWRSRWPELTVLDWPSGASGGR